MSRDSRAWSYHAGRFHRNRVTVYHIVRSPWMRIEWYDDDGRRISRALGHKSRTQAIADCIERAAELGMRRPTHESTNTIVAMRSDLTRVASVVGLPNGVAPSLDQYRAHGEFGSTAVLAAFKGYRGSNPIDTWGRAVQRFGFKPVSATALPTKQEAVADVRAVAHKIGTPTKMPSLRQYEDNGRWQSKTIKKVLGENRWDVIADRLQLTVDPKQRLMAGNARRTPTNAKTVTHRVQREAA